MIVGAYLATALLGVAGGAASGMTAGQAFAAGMLIAAIPASIVALSMRTKTRADTAAALTAAATDLIDEYRKRDVELDRRLAAAEEQTRSVLGSERECRREIAELKTRLNAIVAVADHHPETT